MKVTISLLAGQSVSQEGRKEGTISSADGQSVSQSVRKSYMLSASALLVDIWLSSYIFRLGGGRFFFFSISFHFIFIV